LPRSNVNNFKMREKLEYPLDLVGSALHGCMSHAVWDRLGPVKFLILFCRHARHCKFSCVNCCCFYFVFYVVHNQNFYFEPKSRLVVPIAGLDSDPELLHIHSRRFIRFCLLLQMPQPSQLTADVSPCCSLKSGSSWAAASCCASSASSLATGCANGAFSTERSLSCLNSLAQMQYVQ